MRSSEFHDIPGRPAGGGALGQVAAVLEADHEQRRPEGILVEVRLANTGTGPLAVLNPFETVQFQLIDHAGFPVSLPVHAPRLLLVPTDGPREPAFPVVCVWRDDQPSGESEVAGRVVALGPTGEIRVAMAIGMRRSSAPGAEPIPDGRYRVGSTLTLIDADHPSSSRVLQAAPIDVVLARGGG